MVSGAAFCRFTLDDRERTLSKLEWDKISAGRFSMTPEDFGSYQKFIEQVCVRYECSQAEKKAQKEMILQMKEMLNGL